MAEDYGFGILFCFSIFQCSAQPTSVELSPCSPLLGSGSRHQHVSPKPQPELGQTPPCLSATGWQSEAPQQAFHWVELARSSRLLLCFSPNSNFRAQVNLNMSRHHPA